MVESITLFAKNRTKTQMYVHRA